LLHRAFGWLWGRYERNYRRQWIAPWKNSVSQPEIYHTLGRVVGRDFLLGDGEREHFRTLMRMCEKFTGCRVLTYGLMSNHFHILLEVTPVPEGGITDALLLERLAVFYGEAQVAAIAKEMKETATVRERGEFELPPVDEAGVPLTREEELAAAKRKADGRVEEIRSRYTRRMHDLSWFMKSLRGCHNFCVSAIRRCAPSPEPARPIATEIPNPPKASHRHTVRQLPASLLRHGEPYSPACVSLLLILPSGTRVTPCWRVIRASRRCWPTM
jgi:REP element-mobilizing transposase RayT